MIARMLQHDTRGSQNLSTNRPCLIGVLVLIAEWRASPVFFSPLCGAMCIKHLIFIQCQICMLCNICSPPLLMPLASSLLCSPLGAPSNFPSKGEMQDVLDPKIIWIQCVQSGHPQYGRHAQFNSLILIRHLYFEDMWSSVAPTTNPQKTKHVFKQDWTMCSYYEKQ